jgi:hypothetical protein
VITVATRDCVVIGAWAGRVGEGVAVHQPDAGDLGQQGLRTWLREPERR